MEDPCHCNISHVLNALEDIRKSLAVQQNERQCDEAVERVQCVNDQLGDSNTELRTNLTEQPSSTDVKYEQLRRQYSLIKDLNESLQDDNNNLKTINRILKSNYDTLKERLDLVQSEHRFRLTQLGHDSQVLSRYVRNQREEKRSRSDEYDDGSESSSYHKRRRYGDVGRDKCLQAVESCSSSDAQDTSDKVSNASANDNNDHSNTSCDMSGTYSEDDVEIITDPSTESNIIDISSGNSDSESDADARSEKLDCNDSSEEESLGHNELSYLKPLEQYSIKTKHPQTSLTPPTQTSMRNRTVTPGVMAPFV